MSRKEFRCEIYGKFVSYKAIEDGDVIIDFTPETEYDIENHEFYHKKCKKR